MLNEHIKLKADLLVAGAGISGMCTAISAARKGLSVILINDRSVLGGNASSEIGVVIQGASHHGLNPAIYAKENGIIEEIRLRLAHYYNQGGYGKYAVLDAVFFDMIYNEENINLLLNTVVCECEMKDGLIDKVFAVHSVNNEKYEIKADIYVDATGNGTLAYEAGAEFMIGREGKDEFGEFWAPEKHDDFTMGNSIYFETEDTGKPCSFKAPDFAYDISEMSFMKDINKPENFRGLSCFGPHWAYEYGGQVDILKDHNDIEFELRKLIYGIWDYIKNSGKFPQAETRVLKRVFAKAGSRESRRFCGDYILNENDIEKKIEFKDSVAIGGWPMDIHAPLGIYDSLPASNFVPVTGTYNIPFRCLYSRNVGNLMMAGRNISATHIALGSTRVMATCGAIGQAVGTAVYIAKKYDILPREIYEKHIEELQKILIADDQTILNKNDKSVSWNVQVTSEMEYENTEINEFITLDRDYAIALTPVTEKIEKVFFRIKSKADTTIKYKILQGKHKETYIPEFVKKELSVKVNKDFDNWLEFEIDEYKGEDGKLYLAFEENENIEIATGKKRPVGTVTFRMHKENNCAGKNHDSAPLAAATGYTAIDHIYEREKNILFKDVMPKQKVFSGENIVNGILRPYGAPNIWVAENNKPQTVKLTADKPQDIKEFTLIMNNNLDKDVFLERSASLLKKYSIRFIHKNGEMCISEEENYLRCRKYAVELEEVSEIIIDIAETYGEDISLYGVSIK